MARTRSSPKARTPLAAYHRKRDFSLSPEPRGGRRAARSRAQAGGAAAGLFVIQKHAARSLHYDLRLEVGGVLKSWAVPKGPPDRPGERRLAVHVEDHPLDYADFEGSIPAGTYGAGEVIVWDRGQYVNLTADRRGAAVSMERALEQGSARFWLEGRKLCGQYTLIRTSTGGRADHWLFIRMKDRVRDGAQPAADRPADEASVLTGRTLDDIAASRKKERGHGQGVRRAAPRHAKRTR